MTKTDTIKAGNVYEFFCTMKGTDENGKLLRAYTGQRVTVLHQVPTPDLEVPDVWLVRAEDGVMFDAFTSELNGYHKAHGPYYLPDGSLSWGTIGDEY